LFLSAIFFGDRTAWKMVTAEVARWHFSPSVMGSESMSDGLFRWSTEPMLQNSKFNVCHPRVCANLASRENLPAIASHLNAVEFA
jgi:hypothetical protein